MKQKLNALLLLIACLTLSFNMQAQVDTVIHTSGKYILGPCGDTLTLRGINYAPYNWGYSPNSLNIAEIAQTGANAVRLAWYASSNAPEYSNIAALDTAISQCVQHDMIAIVELHDYTCANSPQGLAGLTAWWTQNPILTVLTKYKQSVIVNYANESLYVNWDNNPTAALATYKSTYQSIIQTLRNVSGFNFPIMLDAPDCGTNSDAFITSSTASDIITADPQHNVIFSAHAYWYAYASNDSTQMAMKINAVLAQNIPFVLGEIANLQDDQVNCQYTLNFRPLLNYCQVNNVGWIAWSWDNDNCSARQVSTNGNFNSLTAYGNIIVNHPNFGLLTQSPAKSNYLVNNGCGSTLGINEVETTALSVFPNPSTGVFMINSLVAQELVVYSILGERINAYRLQQGTTTLDLSALSNGSYILQTAQGHTKIVITH